MTTPCPGPFQLTTRLGDRVIGQADNLPDPFVRHTVHIGRLDLQRGVRDGELVITISLDATSDAVSRVMRALRGDGSCCLQLTENPPRDGAVAGPS